MPGIWPLTPATSSPSMLSDVVVPHLAHVVVLEGPAEQAGVELLRRLLVGRDQLHPARRALVVVIERRHRVLPRGWVDPGPTQHPAADAGNGPRVNGVANDRPLGSTGGSRRRSRSSFGAIFVVELPDKTFVAALVLSTRYRPLRGVGRGRSRLPGPDRSSRARSARLVTYCRTRVVEVVAGLIFLAGAVLLLREAPKADAEEAETEEEYAAKATSPKAGLAAVGASFLVLFAAEWGDLSQLLTISLVGRYHDALSVFIGAWTRPAGGLRPRGRRRPLPAAAHAAVDDPLRRRRGVLPARRRHGVPDRHGVTRPDAPHLECGPCRRTPPPATAPRTAPTRRSAVCARSCCHRPGPELQRLTPRNNDRLLFDGIPWVARAQDEHDAFAAALRERGVEVLYLMDLLTETLGRRRRRATGRSTTALVEPPPRRDDARAGSARCCTTRRPPSWPPT